MPEFLEKSPLSGAGKHRDFQVTLCLQNVSTNVDFAYIESEKMSIFCENTDIFWQFFIFFGLSIRRSLSSALNAVS